MRRYRRILLAPIGLAAAIALWWLASADSTSFYFPPLEKIAEAFQEDWLFAKVPTDLLPSLMRFAAGLAIAIVLGVIGGMLLGISKTARVALTPQVEFLRSTPPVLLLPPSLLIFGTGSGMKIIVIALGSMWPVLLATQTGVRGSDEVALDMARVFGLRRGARLRRVVLPAALPAILAGVRTALPIALVLVVVTELVASTDGIGYTILQAQQTYNLTAMWAGVLLLGLVGMVLSLGVAALERYVQSRIIPTSKGSQS